MSSLTTNFDEVLTRIQHGREFGHASFEPIYYLIFHPCQILEVKRCMPAWTARLRNDGWEVHPFSMAEAIDGVLSARLKHRSSRRAETLSVCST